MRIIAGKFKGTKLFAPAKDVRPTLDRVKEAIFSIVFDRLPGAIILDLFSGSGSLGLEAISRGAASCDFVDKSPGSYKIIKRNIELLAVEDRASVYLKDVAVWLSVNRGKKYDVIFADPPYKTPEHEVTKFLARLLSSGLLHDNSLIILEKYKKSKLELPNGLILCDMRKYGDTEVALIKVNCD